MENILADIVAQKQLEIKDLYAQYDFNQLADEALSNTKNTAPHRPYFYRALSGSRARQAPFFIAEFKRKSPSEGWINRDADLPTSAVNDQQVGNRRLSGNDPRETPRECFAHCSVVVAVFT